MIPSHAVLEYPLSTEKSLRLMESENTLVFVVAFKAKKPDIKKVMEEQFKVKVTSVRTLIVKGKKRAYVTLSPETPAIDIATQFGVM